MGILLIFFGLLIAFVIIGVPVGYSLGIVSVIAIIIRWGTSGLSFEVLAQMLVFGINDFIILAIPLFLLAGALMNESGISNRIFDFAKNLIGHIRGGLGHVNILASFIFSGMSGSAAADVASLGQIEIKAMLDAGYDKDFSCAITGASSTIGPIVPPSVPLVLYGVLAGASVTRLFMGGILPGVLMAIILMIYCSIVAKKRNYPKGDKFNLKKLYISFKKALFALFTPVIIIGGIWIGFFTPTEAAAVAALYSVILGIFIYKELSYKKIINLLKNVTLNSVAILFILACAQIYSAALTRTQIPELIINLLSSIGIGKSPLLILLLLNIVLLIFGCFMSTGATISLLTPLIAPLLPKFGIDPIHFGLIMVLNLMIGQMTPPFGIVLYVLTRVGEIDFDRLVKAFIPFYIPLFVVLLMIIFFPFFVTYLPNLIYGK